MLQKNSDDVKAREQIYILKRKLRNLVRKNKYTYKKALVDKMCDNLSNGQKKLYWKNLKKIENLPDKNTYIPNQTLIDHFENTLFDQNAEIHTTNHSIKGTLDFEITKEELLLASKILKDYKSP